MRDAKELGFKAGAGCGREILLGEKRGADLEMLAKKYQTSFEGYLHLKLGEGSPRPCPLKESLDADSGLGKGGSKRIPEPFEFA